MCQVATLPRFDQILMTEMCNSGAFCVPPFKENLASKFPYWIVSDEDSCTGTGIIPFGDKAAALGAAKAKNASIWPCLLLLLLRPVTAKLWRNIFAPHTDFS